MRFLPASLGALVLLVGNNRVQGQYFFRSHTGDENGEDWCITRAGAGEFSELQLNECLFDSAPEDQLWYMDDEGMIQSASDENQCMIVNHGKDLSDALVNGELESARVRVADCSIVADTNKFISPVENMGSLQLSDEDYETLCVTSQGVKPSPNDRIKIMTCRDKDRFRWELVPAISYQVMSLDGNNEWCIELGNKGTKNFARLRLATCDDSPKQYWRFDNDGMWRSQVDDDKCVIVDHGKSIQDRAKMRIADCDMETDLKFFNYPWDNSMVTDIGDYIIPMENEDFCVSYSGVNPNEGDSIILREFSGGKCRIWGDD